MQQRLKERLVGAAILVVIVVIFIPMILTGPIDSDSITKTNIPDRPTEKFNSKLVPLTDTLKPVTPVEAESKNIEQSMQSETGVNEQKNPGSANVISETIKNNTSKDAKPVQESESSDKQVGLSAWVVQLGSFSSKVNADKLNLQLRKAGFPAFVEPITQKNETAYRVRVGPELLRSDADTLLKKIKSKMNLDGIVLSYP